MRVARLNLAVILVGVLCPSASHAWNPSRDVPDRDGGAIAIRVYDCENMRKADLFEAKRVTDDILRSAGMRPTWLVCTRDDGRVSSERCVDHFGASEVAVRIIRSPQTRRVKLALGFAHLDPETRVGKLASVYADRIAATATRLSLKASMLLGRVVAHEIGHLIGLSRHSSSGLMREHWSDDVLQHGEGHDFLFKTDHGHPLRVGVTAPTHVR